MSNDIFKFVQINMKHLLYTLQTNFVTEANTMNHDQTAPNGAV